MGTEGIWVPLLVGGAIATTAVVGMSQGKGGGGGGSSAPAFKMPSMTAASTQATKTAEKVTAVPQTEQEKLNKRLAASSLTRDWGTLKLSKPGLLGLGGM